MLAASKAVVLAASKSDCTHASSKQNSSLQSSSKQVCTHASRKQSTFASKHHQVCKTKHAHTKFSPHCYTAAGCVAVNPRLAVNFGPITRWTPRPRVSRGKSHGFPLCFGPAQKYHSWHQPGVRNRTNGSTIHTGLIKRGAETWKHIETVNPSLNLNRPVALEGGSKPATRAGTAQAFSQIHFLEAGPHMMGILTKQYGYSS